VRECLTLGTELSAALEHLHHKELIHRDIKPSNIIFVNGAPKLADIGLVTAMEEDRTDVTYVGTPGYIAPEGPGSRAADIFSLGKVLYECAMGRDCAQYPELPSSLLADKDELLELNKVISKACDPDPRCRYSTAKDLHSELLKLQDRFDRGVGAGQRPVGI
jgi:serine/threonine protein kinase